MKEQEETTEEGLNEMEQAIYQIESSKWSP